MRIRQLREFNKELAEGGKSDGVHDIVLSDLERQYASLDELSGQKRFIAVMLEQEVVYRPFRGNIALSQGFKKGTHPAYDWPIPTGTELFNCFPGRAQITFAGQTADGYANNIRFIYPEYNYMALYAHLMPKANWPDWVKVGAWVDPIQLLAISDNTGNSTGPHVHMEIRKPPFTGGYSDCFDFWYMLQELPLVPPIPPEPQPTNDAFDLPDFPTLPQWQLLTTQSLSIRQAPSSSAKLVAYIAPGTSSSPKIVQALGAQKVGNDLWINIGYNEWIAGVYHMGAVENIWGKWIR